MLARRAPAPRGVPIEARAMAKKPSRGAAFFKPRTASKLRARVSSENSPASSFMTRSSPDRKRRASPREKRPVASRAMPPSPETWNPASLVTAAAGAAAHSRCLAQKDGSEKKTKEDVAKTSLPPAFGASSLDSPLLPRAPLDAPDGARSPATTASALKAAAKTAAAAASRGTFLKGEPPAPSPGERLGDEVARVAGGFLSLATSMLDRVDALRGRAEAAGKAERARARELWMLSSPQRARGMRETKADVSQALDACEAELEAAEAEARKDAPSDTNAGGDADVREAFSDASSSDASSDASEASSASSRGSSLGLSDLELSDEEEETRELAAASFAEALARESRKSAASARDARCRHMCAGGGGVGAGGRRRDGTRTRRDARYRVFSQRFRATGKRRDERRGGGDERRSRRERSRREGNPKPGPNRSLQTRRSLRVHPEAARPPAHAQDDAAKTRKAEKRRRRRAARAAAGAVRGLVRGLRLRGHAEKKKPLAAKGARRHAYTRGHERVCGTRSTSCSLRSELLHYVPSKKRLHRGTLGTASPVLLVRVV